MISDESPVENIAGSTAPPEDDTTRADASTPDASPTTPPKPTRARRPRTPKTASASPQTEPASEPEPATEGRPRRARTPRPRPQPAEEEAPGETAATEAAAPTEPRPKARRSRRKTEEPPVADAITAAPTPPEPEPETPTETAPAEPSAPSRPRRSRGRTARAAEATPPPDAQAEAGATAPAEPPARAEDSAQQIETPAQEQEKPARRRTRRTRRDSESPEETPASDEAPVEGPRTERKPQSRRSTSRRRAAPEPEASGPGARVSMRHGHPEIVVNGVAQPPFLFFGNVAGQKEQRRVSSEVARAARAGIHIHSTLIELVCPIPPDDTVYEATDTRLQALIDADPNALLIPRIVFVPAPGWRQQYPNEVNHYADGSTDDPSIASDMFWADAVHALRALVEHVLRTTYGERVIGFHLERGEWFHPADLGYDRSYANREGFRQWLRTKYHNSEVALRAAWYDGAVQFYTVDIPPPPPTDRPDEAFYEPRRERRWVDFNEYMSEATADRLIELSKAVKEATGDRALVSVCYGYTYEFGHTYSGHLALGRLLAAPSIDLVCGPPSYRERPAGASGAFPGPVDSPAIHGKLWISEDDTRTHLSTADSDDFNPRMESRTATEHVHLRALGASLAHQTGIGFMDLWGDGWLDGDDIWQRIAPFVERQAAFARHRKPASPDVVVLVDERSIAHIRRGEKFLRRILQGQRDAFLRCGASVAFCLQSDVTAKTFPTDARLYVFLTPYRISNEQRTAIREKLQNGGKTLVWVYAIGVCADRGEPEESPTDLVGMTLRRQPWHSEVGSRIVDGRHTITERMTERTFGLRERLNPSFYVDDDSHGIARLAEYVQTGFTSLAVREFQEWRSVFCGEPTIGPELARGLCRYAGVHLYTLDTADYVYAGPGWLTHHATRDGVRTIVPPPGLSLYDIVEDRLVDDGAGTFRVQVQAKTTRCFYVGTLEDMRRLGLTNLEPARRTPRTAAAPLLAPPPPLPTFPDLPAQAQASIAAPGDEPGGTLDALAEGGEPDGPLPEGSDDATDEGVAPADAQAEASASTRKRRRRRGGRGRGKRRARPEESGGEVSAAPSE